MNILLIIRLIDAIIFGLIVHFWGWSVAGVYALSYLITFITADIEHQQKLNELEVEIRRKFNQEFEEFIKELTNKDK